MRKIEQQMVNAIKSHTSFSSGNTQVSIDANSAHVFLHGNHIATVISNNNNYKCTMVNKITLKQFPTSTTKSRLRALGVDVYTKKGITYLYGEEV